MWSGCGLGGWVGGDGFTDGAVIGEGGIVYTNIRVESQQRARLGARNSGRGRQRLGGSRHAVPQQALQGPAPGLPVAMQGVEAK